MSAPRSDLAVPLLEVRNLSRHFRVGGGLFGKQLQAVRDVSFTLDHSQVVALVGESGSGKSTTARMLARLLPAHIRRQSGFDGVDQTQSRIAQVNR